VVSAQWLSVPYRRAQRLGHQTLHIHFVGAEGKCRVAGDDQQFARHVFDGKIGAWIRLGVAQSTRFAQQDREWLVAVILVEHPRQRAGEHAFQREQAVTTGTQTAHCPAEALIM